MKPQPIFHMQVTDEDWCLTASVEELALTQFLDDGIFPDIDIGRLALKRRNLMILNSMSHLQCALLMQINFPDPHTHTRQLITRTSAKKYAIRPLKFFSFRRFVNEA